MSGELDKSQYILPLEQPVVSLDVVQAFSQLTTKERMYAYHLSQAAWTGGLITFLQTSPESAPAFVLLHKLFSAQSPEKFRCAALAHGFSESEVSALLVYTAGVFTNAGNYKGFGDTKFIPGVSGERLEKMLKLSPIWSTELQTIWSWFNMKEALFDLREGHRCLGFPPQGCTTYYSENCNPEDSERVQKWLVAHNLESYNTRIFKSEKHNGVIDYEIRLASSECGELRKSEQNKYVYRLVKGDYAPLMTKVAECLEHAVPFGNQAEVFMLQAYIRSFTNGSIDDHKQGSRLWIQNKSPAIETYIGFIETYRDPAGVRGEFEGFVAAVNRPMSEKFGVLVDNAERFLELLPWPKGFEKDTFLRPDFTSLDVLTFAGSGVPAGINIPNYDDIRQSEGFKNVSLGNVIPASYQYSQTPFLDESDSKLLRTWRVAAFELQVGLHELLGHGSGKLFRKDQHGKLNFDMSLRNPITGDLIKSFYHHGDTYDSRFGSMGSAYEECRAEAVGLYLSLEPSVLEIFGHKHQQGMEVAYVNWLALIWAGAGRSLEMWEPGRGWLQAHANARFVLARVLVQAGVANVYQPKIGDLRITLDKAAMAGAGRNAIGHFLLQLQVFKSTGDSNGARNLFMRLSEVEEPWLSWRSVILANKQPRNMLVQPNIMLHNKLPILETYESNVEGLIDSWINRFPNPEPLYSAMVELAKSDVHHFV